MKQRFYLLLMLLLTVLPMLAEQVVYTPSSRSSVKVSDDKPEDTDEYYVNTSTSGKSGQMTQGNTVLLALSGFGQVDINRVVVVLHTNNSAGGGTMKLSVGEDVIYQTITEKLFAGKDFSSEPYRLQLPITNPLQVGDSLIILEMVAKESSLYFDSLIINYTKPVPLPRTVSFQTFTSQKVPSVTEKDVESGIMLPSFEYENAPWRFVGWAEEPTTDTQTLPQVYQQGGRYFPKKDVTLYAIYADGEEVVWVEQDTLFQPGDYLLTNNYYQCMSSGIPNSKGRIPIIETSITLRKETNLYCIQRDSWSENAVYHLDFNDIDSTLTIMNVERETYIGYPVNSSKILTKSMSKWSFTFLDNHQLVIYHNYIDAHRELRAELGENLSDADVVSYGFLLGNSPTGNILFRVDNLPSVMPITYTSYPEGTACAQLPVEVMILPDKVLNPNRSTLMLFSLSGQLLTTTTADLCLTGCQAGIYLLRVQDKVYKILRR